MDEGDDLWASLSRLAGEAGRAARQAAERGADLASGSLGKDQFMKWPSNLLTGSIIPEPYRRPGQRLTWHDGYMATCAHSVFRAVQHHGALPATSGLVAAQVALHLKPGGYQLLKVGMNAQRVLRYREWRRCATAPLLHSDLPHLVSNCTAVVLEGLPLEQRLGPARFLGLVASAAALTQGLHLLVSKVAADWLPRTALAGQYYSAYGVGFSGVAMALRVVAGYMRESNLARAQVAIPDEFLITAGRLAAWPSILLAHSLIPCASLPIHLCGAAAGVLQVYAARLAGWLWMRLRGRRRLSGGLLAPPPRLPRWLDLGNAGHPNMGWLDLGAQALLGVGTMLAAASIDRMRGKN